MRDIFGRRVFYYIFAVVSIISFSWLTPAFAKKDKYTIYLSNNFTGNDWRQQMVRSIDAAVAKGPMAGRVDLHIQNTENSVQAQTASLLNIIRAAPDAILIDPASPAALDPAIEKACAAGVLVVVFDQPVSAPCAYNVVADWPWIGKILTEWLGQQLGDPGGNVVVDRGMAGTPNAATFMAAYQDVLKQYPNVHIIGYFDGAGSIGPEQAGMSAQLAAHPSIDGLLSQGYGVGALKAQKDAGRPQTLFTAVSYNGSAVQCVQEKVKCILAVNPSWDSAEALKTAIDILDGNKPEQKTTFVHFPFLTTDPITSKVDPSAKFDKIVLGTNAYPDQSPGLTLPISPDWMQITPQEAAGK